MKCVLKCLLDKTHSLLPWLVGAWFSPPLGEKWDVMLFFFLFAPALQVFAHYCPVRKDSLVSPQSCWFNPAPVVFWYWCRKKQQQSLNLLLDPHLKFFHLFQRWRFTLDLFLSSTCTKLELKKKTSTCMNMSSTDKAIINKVLYPKMSSFTLEKHW